MLPMFAHSRKETDSKPNKHLGDDASLPSAVLRPYSCFEMSVIRIQSTSHFNGGSIMSVSAITSNLLHQQQMPGLQSGRGSFADLASTLTSGSPAGSLLSLLSGTSPSSGSLSGTSSPTSAPSSSQSILTSELTALGAQLQAGNLSGAQQAYSAFTKDLGVTGSQGPSHFHGQGGHSKPVYSSDGNSVTTANSGTSNPAGPTTFLA
jgi:hypothetical protein